MVVDSRRRGRRPRGRSSPGSSHLGLRYETCGHTQQQETSVTPRLAWKLALWAGLTPRQVDSATCQ